MMNGMDPVPGNNVNPHNIPINQTVDGIKEKYDALEKVLGRIPDIVKYDHPYHQSRAYSDLTELLIKRAPFVVEEQVKGLLRQGYHSVLCHEILPMKVLRPEDGLRIEWSSISFEPGIAPQVEVEGVAPVFTHNRTKNSTHAVRRAGGIRIEAGFYQTEEGRREWRLKIEQIAAIIQRTNEFDVMMAILEAPMRAQLHGDELNGPYNVYGIAGAHMGFMDRLRMEVDYFGIVNKTPDSRGLNNMVTSIRTEMARNEIEPDYMIVPGGMVGFFLQDKNDLWHYNSAGPQALQNRANAHDINNNKPIRSQQFQGLKLVDLHLYRPTQGFKTDEAIDLLTTHKQIGEFYLSEANSVCSDVNEFKDVFRGRDRDISIFNEKHGIFTPVRYADMLRNCLRWGPEQLQGPKFPFPHTHADIEVGGDGAPEDMFVTTQGRAVKFWYEMDRKYLSKRTLECVAATLGNLIGKHKMETVPAIFDAYMDLLGPNALVKAADGTVIDPQDAAYEDRRNELKTQLARPLMESFKAIWNTVRGFGNENANNHRDGIDNMIVTPYESAASLDLFMEACRNMEEHASHLFLSDGAASSALHNHYLFDALSTMTTFQKCMLTHWLQTPVNLYTLLDQHEKDVYIPIDFLLCRPYMTYKVSAAVIIKGGHETGSLMVGHTQFSAGESSMDRMIYGQFSYHSRAFVREERNVCIAPSVFIQGYVKGNDTSFISEHDLEEIANNAGLFESKNSILCMAIPVDGDTAKHTVIDIRGRHEHLVNEVSRYETDPFYASAAYYRNLFQIEGTDLSNPTNPFVDFQNNGHSANSICFRGAYKYGRGMTKETINTGHLGCNTYNNVHLSRKPNSYVPVQQVFSTGVQGI